MTAGTLDGRAGRPDNGGMYAVLSVWIALGALVTTIAVAVLPKQNAEAVITLLPYTFAFSATLAAGVLWAFRKRRPDEQGVAGQRLQAFTSIAINSVSLAVLLFTMQTPLHAFAALAIEFSFLSICWWSYKRVVLKE